MEGDFHMKKKVLSLLLAVIMVAGLIPVATVEVSGQILALQYVHILAELAATAVLSETVIILVT